MGTICWWLSLCGISWRSTSSPRAGPIWTSHLDLSGTGAGLLVSWWDDTLSSRPQISGRWFQDGRRRAGHLWIIGIGVVPSLYPEGLPTGYLKRLTLLHRQWLVAVAELGKHGSTEWCSHEVQTALACLSGADAEPCRMLLQTPTPRHPLATWGGLSGREGPGWLGEVVSHRSAVSWSHDLQEIVHHGCPNVSWCGNIYYFQVFNREYKLSWQVGSSLQRILVLS